MDLYVRENYLAKIRGFYHTPELIKVITGIRRCGKSSIMRMIADEIIGQGVAKENCLFIDLDNREWRKVKTITDLEQVIDASFKGEQLKYLFIDEIQNLKNFEVLLNGYRNEGGYSIFITGSNSYLLSGELITKLTGRYIEFEIFPLSFQEYIGIKKFYRQSTDPNLLVELNNYIIEGGFPGAVQFTKLSDKRTYTLAIVSEIMEKDIRRRVKVRDVALFTRIRTFLINNFGQPTSVSSLQRALEATGIRIKRETLSKYLEILVNAKILHHCPRFDVKTKKSLSGVRKYYLADLSFYFSLNTDNRINYGPVLENIIYLYCRATDYSVSVGLVGSLECDFIVRSQASDYAYIQVSFSILESKATEDKEYAPLEKIADNYPKYVLTTDLFQQKRNGIIHACIMEFLANGTLFC